MDVDFLQFKLRPGRAQDHDEKPAPVHVTFRAVGSEDPGSKSSNSLKCLACRLHPAGTSDVTVFSVY